MISKKFAVFIIASGFVSSAIALDRKKEKDLNENISLYEKSIVAAIDNVRPEFYSFALTWLGKLAYKKTDLTSHITKKIAFASILAPMGLLYLHHRSNKGSEYNKSLQKNGLCMMAGFGLGLLVPTFEKISVSTK